MVFFYYFFSPTSVIIFELISNFNSFGHTYMRLNHPEFGFYLRSRTINRMSIRKKLINWLIVSRYDKNNINTKTDSHLNLCFFFCLRLLRIFFLGVENQYRLTMYGIKETKSQICATGFFVRSASKHSSLKKVKIWCTIVNQFEVDIRIIFYFIQVWIWDAERTLIYTRIEWWKNNIFLLRLLFFSMEKIDFSTIYHKFIECKI